MLMQLDAFAALIGVRPGVLLHAARTDGLLEGLSLPERRRVRGATLMFEFQEAMDFAERWHRRLPPEEPEPTGEPMVPLDAFAREAGIVPLALWLAVTSRKSFAGVKLPAGTREGELILFEPGAVARFIRQYRDALLKK